MCLSKIKELYLRHRCTLPRVQPRMGFPLRLELVRGALLLAACFGWSWAVLCLRVWHGDSRKQVVCML